GEREVPIYMHPKGIELCEKKAKLPIYRQVFWGKRPPFKAEPVSDIFRTPEYTWETIYTPGHADDHIALYNREKGWMFGGDLFVMPKPKSMYRFESLPTLIRSLRKVLTYNFDVYIDSHAGILPDGKKRLQEKLRYLIQVQQEVLFLYNEGTSVSKIRKKLFPERHFMHYVSLFENSPKHMIRSIIHQHYKVIPIVYILAWMNFSFIRHLNTLLMIHCFYRFRLLLFLRLSEDAKVRIDIW